MSRISSPDAIGVTCAHRRYAKIRAASTLACVLLLGVTPLALAQSAESVESAETANPELLGTLRIIEGDVLTGPRLTRRGVALPGDSLIWPDGLIPYRFDASINDDRRARIQSAIDHWNRVASITLTEITDEDAMPRDRLVFEDGPGCASWIGRQGGEQEVWISGSCSEGSILHEIGHALGLEHEHTRPDRDQFIEVRWDNIDTDRQHNFELAPRGSTLLGDYDYASIMHYGPRNFSRNGEETLVPILDRDIRIGQRDAPSAGDLASLNELYQSDLALRRQLQATTSGTLIRLMVDNLHRQGAHGIEIELHVGQRRLSQEAGSDWDCQANNANARVLCRLRRLGPGETSGLVLHSDVSAELLRTLAVELRTKTYDVNRLNNREGGVLPDVGHPSLSAANADPVRRLAQSQFVVDEQGGVGGLDTGLLLVLGLLGWCRRCCRGDGAIAADRRDSR